MPRALLPITFLVALFAASLCAAPPKPEEKTELFIAGVGGYETYRIPGIIATPKGTLIAYCEARKLAKSDWGQIDLMLRRSTDGGKTWSEAAPIGKLPKDVVRNEVAVAQKLGTPGKFTMNNPVAIAAKDGTVHFLYCVEYARCFYQRSDDDGATFSEPVEITGTFATFRDDYAWKVLATGPGHGIELATGRLVVPVWLSTGTGGHAHRPSVVATIYSDDKGKTWQRGEFIAQHGEKIINPSETALVELADGRVMANIRSESKENRRLVSISADGATKWSEPEFEMGLKEPICMASMVRVDDKTIAFANPDNLQSGDKPGLPGKGRDRKNLAIQLSDSNDDGDSWFEYRVIEPGFSAYSDLAIAKDGSIVCFYENSGAGGKPYGALTLVKMSVKSIQDSEDMFAKHVPWSFLDFDAKYQLTKVEVIVGTNGVFSEPKVKARFVVDDNAGLREFEEAIKTAKLRPQTKSFGGFGIGPRGRIECTTNHGPFNIYWNDWNFTLIAQSPSDKNSFNSMGLAALIDHELQQNKFDGLSKEALRELSGERMLEKEKTKFGK